MLDATGVNGNSSSSAILRSSVENDRATLEEQIEVGLRKAEEGQRAVAEALTKIRDEKLYKPEFKSFAGYVDAKFKRSRRWAYQLIEYLGILKSVNHGAHFEPNERQARELSRLSEKQRQTAWDRAFSIAVDDGREAPSQADVKAAVAFISAVTLLDEIKRTVAELASEPGGEFLPVQKIETVMNEIRRLITTG